MEKIVKRKEEIHRGSLILVNRDYPLIEEEDRQL